MSQWKLDRDSLLVLVAWSKAIGTQYCNIRKPVSPTFISPG